MQAAFVIAADDLRRHEGSAEGSHVCKLPLSSPQATCDVTREVMLVKKNVTSLTTAHMTSQVVFDNDKAAANVAAHMTSQVVFDNDKAACKFDFTHDDILI